MTWPRRPNRRKPSADSRYPSPSRGRLRVDLPDDAITGLVAWPRFFDALPSLVARTIAANRAIGVAVGDVDNLKAHVERRNTIDAQSFGHLAGNAVMARLGAIARAWLWSTGPAHACLATFGGDEIVVVAEAPDQPTFSRQVGELRDASGACLPCTVSFATDVISPNTVGSNHDDQWWRDYIVQSVGQIDRTLFAHKHARKSGEPIPDGFVVAAQLHLPRINF